MSGRGTIATANRARARRRIIAAAAAALEVLELRARYVSETDDRPRAWLERFARGEDRIGACPWRVVQDDRPLFALLYRLSDARGRVAPPTHADGQAGAVVACLAHILRVDCGEPDDAATARADTIYRAHLARLEREAVEAMLSACARASPMRRAAADRHAAELALGTATEVSR